MVGVLLLAALLRFHRLDFQSLWFDELMSWVRSSLGTLREVSQSGAERNWPPGYFFLLHYVINLIGDSGFIMRFPSALVGVMSVAAIYPLGRRLFDDMTGVIAAAVLTVLWPPVFYSQEARAYSFLILFAITSTFFWHRMLGKLDDGTLSGWDAAGYAASAIALAYLHYFGVLLVFLQGAAAGLHLLRKPRHLLMIGGLYLAIAVSYLPQIAALFDSAGRVSGWIKPPPIYPITLVATLAYFFNYQIIASGLGLALILASAIFSLIDKTNEVRLRPPSVLGSNWLLVGWMIGLPTVIYLRSVLYSPVFLYRYSLLSAPAAYLLLAHALTKLPGGKLARVVAALAITVFYLGNLIYGLDYYSAPTKTQIREAVGYVTSHPEMSREDLVIGDHNGEILDYYFEKLGGEPRVDMVARDKDDIPAIARFIAEHQPPAVWYIAVHEAPDKDIVAYLTEHMTLAEHEQWFNAEVWFFKAPGGAASSDGG
jgi:mannosyltransferase